MRLSENRVRICFFFFSSRRRHTSSVSAFLLNRSSDLKSGSAGMPRFFVPEHGTMFTLALVRFPPTATKEIQYLNAKGALRSEERRVGKECSSLWESYYLAKVYRVCCTVVSVMACECW